MARDKLTEYSATASDNTVCGDVNIAENSALPSDMNNFAREVMSHLKNFSDGTDAIDALAVDNLKLDGNTISSTDTNGDINLSPNGTGEVLVSTELGVALPSGQAAESNLHVIGDTAGLVASDIARFEGNNDGGNRGLRISQVASGGTQAAIDLQGYHSQSDANVWNLHMQSAGGNVAIGQSNPNTVPSALTMGSGKNIRMLGDDARIEFLNSGSQYTLNSSGGAGIRFHRPSAGHEEIAFETHDTGIAHAERMRLHAEGWITKPYQPLFAVTGPPSNNTYNTSPVTNYFTAVRYNVGGHYHTSGTNGGKFITPAAGVYLFEFGMFVNAANTFRLELKVNGVTVTNPYITGHNASMGTGYPVPTGHQILKLAAGDSVQWGVNGTAYLYGGHTGFAGYFLG